jgi:ferric-dicitrate binding protein FerR (iron transport regulator)
VKQEHKHNNIDALDRQSKSFFSGGTFEWKKREIEIWTALESKIDANPKRHFLFQPVVFSRLTAAASIIILLSVTAFLRFYSVSIHNPEAQHSIAILPDQSRVELNANSTLSYNPYWWRISRKVKLEGEGFFEVQKGKRFTVVSLKGNTQVVGTSFNIFAREEIYKVTCVTGKVRVKSQQGFEVLLLPNSKAEIQSGGEINISENIETYPEISWKKNIFLFTASPVLQVFKEIERQYGIRIDAKIDDNSLYTGNFTKDQHVEEILEYVCPAMNLKYIRKSADEFLITRKD